MMPTLRQRPPELSSMMDPWVPKAFSRSMRALLGAKLGGSAVWVRSLLLLLRVFSGIKRRSLYRQPQLAVDSHKPDPVQYPRRGLWAGREWYEPDMC